MERMFFSRSPPDSLRKEFLTDKGDFFYGLCDLEFQSNRQHH